MQVFFISLKWNSSQSEEAGGAGGAEENKLPCGHGGAEGIYLAEGNDVWV